MLTKIKHQQPQVQRLARQLPRLHEAIYTGLRVLLPHRLKPGECLVSQINGSPDLHLDVLEQHEYTTYVQLSYVLGKDAIRNPNAYIRIYHDAKLAEATAFSPEQGIQRFAGPELPLHGQVVRGWRLNRALVKWLDYLLAQGHDAGTFKRTACASDFLPV